LTYISDPRDVTLYGTGLDMLWVAGDGNRPTIWNGAPLAPAAPDPLTLVGVPVAEVSPYQLEGGADVALEGHTGASCRVSLVASDPGPADDVVIVVVGRVPPVAGVTYFFSTGAAGERIGIFVNAANQLGFEIVTSGGFRVSAPPVGHVARSGLFASVFWWDSTADTCGLWTIGGSVGPIPIADGTIAASGIGIGSTPNQAQKLTSGGGIIVDAYLLGAGIAAAWTAGTYAKCKDLAFKLTGVWPRIGGRPTMTRATARSRYDRNSRLWIYSSGLAAAGDSEDLVLDPAGTNKCYNTINPADTTGWTATGGTHTAAADTAALATAGLQSAGPNVHKFVPGAGDEVLYGGGATGGATAHSLSCYLRGEAGGETVVVGLRDPTDGAVQVGVTATLTTAWVRYSVDALVPADTDQQFCLDCDAGDTVYAVLQQLEQAPVISSPIPNWATAAGATRNQTTLALAVTPADGAGSIELTVTPDGWSAAEAGTVALLTRATGSPASLTCTTGTWQAALDGTTTLDSTVAPAAGVAHRIRLRWTAATMSIEVRLASTDAVLARVDGAYDGALNGTGAWTLAAGAPVSVKNLKCYRSGGG
jgi:hypothetical protein